MSFQAYLDNVKAETGKTPDDFAKLASQRGLASWNAMVTHRVRISDPTQIDREVISRLRRAYDAAG